MSIQRWLAPAFVIAALSVWSSSAASAQGAADWPNKTVRIIVNFAPGGSADNSMRPYAERLSKILGQQFVLEHRGGASGAIGLEAAMKSPPDGYTFVVTPGLSLMIVPHLRKTAYDPLVDLKPVSMLTIGTVLFCRAPDGAGRLRPRRDRPHQAAPGQTQLGHGRHRVDGPYPDGDDE